MRPKGAWWNLEFVDDNFVVLYGKYALDVSFRKVERGVSSTLPKFPKGPNPNGKRNDYYYPRVVDGIGYCSMRRMGLFHSRDIHIQL